MMMKLAVKSNVTLNDLMAKALDIESRCKDYVLPGATIGRGKTKRSTGAMNPGLTSACVAHNKEYGELRFLAPIGNGNGSTVSIAVSAELSQWAFYQLCSIRLGVPHSYMKKCIDSPLPDVQKLFEENVNTLMSHYDSATRIRLYQPEAGAPLRIRGIVSGSYTVFDTDQVLETVHEVLGDGFNIKGYFINEEGLHLRMATPEPLQIDGEDLYPGFLITSGDVGNRSLEVQFFLWKQVCTNGLVMSRVSGKILHKRHLGIYDPVDFKSSLVSALESFPIFCENAKTLVEEARSKELTSDMLQARLKAFGREVKLQEKEKETITKLTANYGMTLWGLVNALTEFAQAERFDLDERTAIEIYAGNMLTKTAA